MARILVNRNITTEEEAHHFLFDTVDDLADPFLMKDMEKAARRICLAVQRGERIVIYGDYDVDGITSTSLLCFALRGMGADPSYYIPERQDEGYGLNAQALEKLVEQHTDLLITVDCGISSYDDVAAYHDTMDVIITDHHEPPEMIPPAFAVLNPKQSGCTYPFRELAGVGVAFTLCRALRQMLKQEPCMDHLELAALGTIADMVPLTGENRIIVIQGLKQIRQGKNPGIQALLEAASIDHASVTAGRIAFTIAPRLNAAGRISHADKGVQLLLEEDAGKAGDLAVELSEMNRRRQEIERDITKQAIDQIEKKGYAGDGVLVVSDTGWHAGVIGIVASSIVERYYRPALVISLTGDIGKGSCRSISGFNMYEALQYTRDLLIQFGGHMMAAGFSIEKKNIELFRQQLNEYADAHMKAEDYIPTVDIDMAVSPDAVTLDLVKELALLEPYGMGNNRPIFSMTDVMLDEFRPIGKDKRHLRFSVASGTGGRRVSGVGWSMSELCGELLTGDTVDVAFQLERNDFNGTSSPQMILQDITNAAAAPIRLDRKIMVAVYLALRSHLSGHTVPVWQIRRQMLSDFKDTLDGHVVYAALSVFREIGILEMRSVEEGPVYDLPTLSRKMKLETSSTFMKYNADGGDHDGVGK